MIQQRFHFILNLTLNFNSLKDKKPRDIRCNEIKQSFSDSKFDANGLQEPSFFDINET